MQVDFGLGKRLRQARERKGLNKTKLGAKVGTSGTSINNIETGETKNPSALLLESIATTLDVNLRWLLTGEGDMDKNGATVSGKSYHIGTGNANVQGEGNKTPGTGDCERHLALALAKIEALEEKVKDRDNQIIFLKSLLQK